MVFSILSVRGNIAARALSSQCRSHVGKKILPLMGPFLCTSNKYIPFLYSSKRTEDEGDTKYHAVVGPIIKKSLRQLSTGVRILANVTLTTSMDNLIQSNQTNTKQIPEHIVIKLIIENNSPNRV
jgi:hypothetical protein